MKEVLSVTTPSDTEIRIVRAFASPRPRVFDCWTKPELLQRWMTGMEGWVMAVCHIDLRVGGAYRFVWKGPDGSEMGMGGVYRDIVVPQLLVSTEKYDMDWTGGETWGTVQFTEEQLTAQTPKTTVTTTLRYTSKQARDGALQSGMAEGMGVGFDRLEQFLQSQP